MQLASGPMLDTVKAPPPPLTQDAPPGAAPVDLGRRHPRAWLLAGSLLLLVWAALAWSAFYQARGLLAEERAQASRLAIEGAARLARLLRQGDEGLHAFAGRERAGLKAMLAGGPEPSPHASRLWIRLRAELPSAEAALVIGARGERATVPTQTLDVAAEQRLRAALAGRPAGSPIAPRGEGIAIDFIATWHDATTGTSGLLVRTAYPSVAQAIGLAPPAGLELRLVQTGGANPYTPGDPLAQSPVEHTPFALAAYRPGSGVALVGGRLAAAAGAGLVALALVIALIRTAPTRTGVAPPPGAGPTTSGDRSGDAIKLQAVLATTTDGILVIDRQGRIESFNAAAEMLFGRLAEDVHSANVFKLLPAFFSANEVPALLDDLGGPGSPRMVETTARRKGGQELPVRAWLTRVAYDGTDHLLMAVQDLSEHQSKDEHLSFLQERDLLTRLLNRHQLELRLGELLDDTTRTAPAVLCHIDVDQLKLVNDACGHAAGDELLRQLAVLVESKLAGQIVGRLGGDELGAIFPRCAIDEAYRICDGLIQTVQSFLFTWRDRSFDVSVSIGLIELRPGKESASTALSKVDVACQMAKAGGRSRIHVYSQGSAAPAKHGEMQLVATITRALNEGNFQLYAQPIVPVGAAAERMHFEILVRMTDENGQLVSPAHFIPAAERYGLMPEVDRWIINHLFEAHADTLRRWAELVPDSFLFAVNLSGATLTDQSFLRFLKRQFSDWRIPYGSICFEVTETTAIASFDYARAFIGELSSLGCTFALDDFGSGLSSYTYLRELPVRYLKIDGSFVRAMADDPVNYALVESINHIGHVLGLKTIAEWAENDRIVGLLQAMKVDFAQGYAVGRPLPVAVLTLDDTRVRAYRA